MGKRILTRTSNAATNPRMKRMRASMKASLLLRLAKTSSSNRNGADNAIAKGHPSIPPTANQNIPCEVFKPPLQFMNAAIPSIVMYIAKLEGRKAAEAWKIPGLDTIAIKKNKATRWFNVILTTLNIWVWHKAQTKAKTYRMK
jgi:hypothetical protein